MIVTDNKNDVLEPILGETCPKIFAATLLRYIANG
jgi:hypothetical protein